MADGREDRDPIVLPRNVRVLAVPVVSGQLKVAEPPVAEVTVG
jgi:hypothetical protein